MTSRVVVTAAVALVVGFLMGQASTRRANAQAPGPKPAFMVVSSRPISPDKMGPYRQAAIPLATRAGMQMVASGNPALHVLEGKWTLPGSLSIEQYRSMDDLLEFWNSPGYQDAKKLRAGLVEMNFIVAIEGR